jgi:hypothetical protein
MMMRRSSLSTAPFSFDCASLSLSFLEAACQDQAPRCRIGESVGIIPFHLPTMETRTFGNYCQQVLVSLF